MSRSHSPFFGCMLYSWSVTGGKFPYVPLKRGAICTVYLQLQVNVIWYECSSITVHDKLVWHLSAQLLSWLEFQFEDNHQLFYFQIGKALRWNSTQLLGSQMSLLVDNSIFWTKEKRHSALCNCSIHIKSLTHSIPSLNFQIFHKIVHPSI